MSNDRFRGPIPWADLSAFARSQAGTTACQANATIVVSPSTLATQASLSSGSCFQNGDGITIYGAGQPTRLSTPSISSVTSASVSVGGTALGGGSYSSITTVQGATGSFTYYYTIVARDKFGGYTAASSPLSTTSGLPSLGTFNCAIRSETRSGTNMIVNFSSACEGAIVGAAMQVIANGTGGVGFSGFYNIQTVNSPTQVVAVGPLNSTSFGWSAGDAGANSTTGGTAYFISSNHLSWTYESGVWEYYVCAKRPRDLSYHLIGRTYPSSSIYQDVQFDDYGSPFNDSQLYPTYIETASDHANSNDAICTNTVGFPDPLTTTVASGGGTAKIVLSKAASTSVPSTLPASGVAKFDDGPGLLAAANSVSTAAIQGQVFIPPTKYFIVNSYTKLPSNVVIQGSGAVKFNETLEVPGSVAWDGRAGGSEGSQFSYFSSGGQFIYMGTAYPIMYVSGNTGVHISNITFLTESNYNGQLAIVDDGSNTQLDNDQFILSQGTNDNYLATAIIFRGTGASNPSFLDIYRSLFVASTMTASAATWTPYVYAPATQNRSGGLLQQQGGIVSVQNTTFYQRGSMMTACGGGSDWRFTNVVRQGGMAPLLWLEAGNCRLSSVVKYDNVDLDTDTTGILSVGNQVGKAGLASVNVEAFRVQANSQPGATFSGFGPTDYSIAYSSTTALPNATGKAGLCASIATVPSTNLNCNFDYESFIGPNARIFYPLSAPTDPTAKPRGGGNLTPGSFEFKVVANDVTGQSSIASAATSAASTSRTCPGSGNCEISVAWTNVPGAASYSIYGCQVSGTPVMPACPSFSNLSNGTNVTMNPFVISAVARGSGNSQPQLFTTAGISGVTSRLLWGPSLLANPQKFAALAACTTFLSGMQATVTDSTTDNWGTTITGGGSKFVLAFCNGTNWTVYGK